MSTVDYCRLSCDCGTYSEPRGARSARADARLCTSSGINLIVPLSFHLVRYVTVQAMARSPGDKEPGQGC